MKMKAYGFQAADALEVIPTMLAENDRLNLRNRHALGGRYAGINIRKVRLHSLSMFRAISMKL
jgi:T-complex protein 1 subunit delta